MTSSSNCHLSTVQGKAIFNSCGASICVEGKKYIITYGTTATTSSHRFLAEKSKLNLKEKLKVSFLSISSNTSIKVCSFCVFVVT